MVLNLTALKKPCRATIILKATQRRLSSRVVSLLLGNKIILCFFSIIRSYMLSRAHSLPVLLQTVLLSRLKRTGPRPINACKGRSSQTKIKHFQSRVIIANDSDNQP